MTAYNKQLKELYNEVFEEFKTKNINLKHEIEIYFPKYKDDCYMKANATKYYYRIDVFPSTIINESLKEDDIKDIFRHELAHLIEYDRIGSMTGHGKAFKNICFEIWNNRKIGNAEI